MRDAAPLFAELRAAALAPQRSLTVSVTGVRQWAGSLRDAGERLAFLRDVPGVPALGLAELLDPLAGTALSPSPDGTAPPAHGPDSWATPAEPPGLAHEGGFPGAGSRRAGLDPFSGTVPTPTSRARAGAESSRPGDLVQSRPTPAWKAPLTTGGGVRSNDPPFPSDRATWGGRGPLGPSVLPLSTNAPESPDPAIGSRNAPTSGGRRSIGGEASRFEEREDASGGSIEGPRAPPPRAASIHGLLDRLEGVGEAATRPLEPGGPKHGRTGAPATRRLPWPGSEPSPVAHTGRGRPDSAPAHRSRGLTARLVEAAPSSDRAASPPAGGSDVPDMAHVVRLLEGVVGELGSIGAMLAEAGQWGSGPSGNAPAVRWLEDDELAGRLQRILMRQARGRGIDLS